MSSDRSTVVIVEPASSGGALVRAARELGFRAVVASYDQDDRRQPDSVVRDADALVRVDTNDDEALASALMDLAARESLAAVVPGFEFFVPTAARLGRMLGLPALEPDAALACRDKAVMRRTVEAAGLRVPRYAAASNETELAVAARVVGFPCVLKPTSSAGSVHVSRADSWEELLGAYRRLTADERLDYGRRAGSHVLVEQYIAGPEFSVEGAVAVGRVETLAITAKFLGPEPYFVEMGHIVHAELDESTKRELERYAVAVVRALGISLGPFHCEVRLDGSPVLMEVGARLPGDHIVDLVQITTGRSLPRIMVATYAGIDHGASSAAPARASYAGIRFFTAAESPTDHIRKRLDATRREPWVLEVEFDSTAHQPAASNEDFRCRVGHAIFVADDYRAAEQRWRQLGQARAPVRARARQPRTPTYLVINRFDDEFAEYHRFLPEGGARLAYITTESGLGRLDSEHTVDVRVVADTRFATVLPEARDLAVRWGAFDGVVGLSEWDVLTAARIREQLGTVGYRSSFVARFRDKPLMKQMVATAGLAVPRFCVPDRDTVAADVVAAIGLPMIVKPRAGAASAGVRRVETLRELEVVLNEVAGRDVECEEFIAGDIFHVDGVRRGSRFLVVTVSEYVNTCLDFARGAPLGSVWLDEGPTRSKVLAFADGCLAALGLEDGPFHLELFRSCDGNLVFLEVGLRPGGAEVPFLHRDLLGVDLYAEAFRATLGLPPVVNAPPKREGSGGWVIFPEPGPLPSRVVSATSLRHAVPEIYSERIPSPGEIFDGTGVYDHVGGSFRLRARDEAQVRAAIERLMTSYRVVAVPAPALEATAGASVA